MDDKERFQKVGCAGCGCRTRTLQEASLPRSLTVSTLPQETGRWVAEVRASGLLDGPSFSSLGYGDRDFKAIAEALKSLARMYQDYRGGETRQNSLGI